MKQIQLIAEQSAALDVTTPGYDLRDLTSFSVAATFTGSNVVGTIKLEASLDNIAWFDVPSSQQSVTASSNAIWAYDPCAFRFVRLNWDYTSGTGNISAVLFAKDPIVKNS